MYYAIYKGDQYLYDGTLEDVSLRTGYPELYIKNVLTKHNRIEQSINNDSYEDLIIAVEIDEE